MADMANPNLPAPDLLRATNELALQTREAFADFLETFKLDDGAEPAANSASQDDANEPHYIHLLKLMVEEDSTVLEVDFEHIHLHSPPLATVNTGLSFRSLLCPLAFSSSSPLSSLLFF